MYLRRIPYISRHNIDLQKISTPELLNSTLPQDVNNPSNNLKNLFELPTIFYAICIIIFVTSSVDSLYLKMAWAFVAFRIIHSMVHVTINSVNYRFMAYFISSLALWAMIIRFGINVL